MAEPYLQLLLDEQPTNPSGPCNDAPAYDHSASHELSSPSTVDTSLEILKDYLSPLPLDIKVLLLKELGSFRSLGSLVLSCKVFNTSFKAFRKQIIQSILCGELHQNDGEMETVATMLYRAQAMLGEGSSMCDVRSFLVKHFPCPVDPLIPNENLPDPSVEYLLKTAGDDGAFDGLLENHMACRKIARRFLEWRLDPEGGLLPMERWKMTGPYTESEERRMTFAAYRLWLVLTICKYQRAYCPEDGHEPVDWLGQGWIGDDSDPESVDDYHDYVLSVSECTELMMRFDFWDAETVVWLYKFLQEKVEANVDPGWTEIKSDEIWRRDLAQSFISHRGLLGVSKLLSMEPASPQAWKLVKAVMRGETTPDQDHFNFSVAILRELTSSFVGRGIPAAAKRLFRAPSGVYHPLSCRWVTRRESKRPKAKGKVARAACMFDGWRLKEWGYHWHTQLWENYTDENGKEALRIVHVEPID